MTTSIPPYGVLGRTLKHSYSPRIYQLLGIRSYERIEREPEELETLFISDAWRGMNVTIPYKRAVLPYLDEMTETARQLGNVNTVWRATDGRIIGHNTDFEGFQALLEASGVEVAGRKVVVFGGSGGAGTTATAVLEDAGADVVSIGRSGSETYDALTRHADAVLAVNATPCGMYPACPAAPCSLDDLPNLEGLIDIIYNPARTQLMMEAERRGITVVGGLLMLVAQAAGSFQKFTGKTTDPERIQDITRTLEKEMLNIALIGMPGAGKTRVGREIARILGREHVDVDDVLCERLGMSCAEHISTRGEDAFRHEETAALAEIAAKSGQVISCGGGIVVRSENYELLHQNSRIVLLDRALEELSSKGRPLSQRHGVEQLARERMPRYTAWADTIIRSRATPARTAQAVIAALTEEQS